MLVVKRDGKKEPVAFDKITARIKKLCYGFNPEHVDPVVVAQKVVTVSSAASASSWMTSPRRRQRS